MLKIALLTLTMTAEGEPPRLTLSEMESAAACAEAQDRVTRILTQSGIRVLAALCGPSDLRLTPFDHGATPEDERFRYRVELDPAGGFRVTPLAADAACEAAPKAQPAIHCARSSQEPLPPG